MMMGGFNPNLMGLQGLLRGGGFPRPTGGPVPFQPPAGLPAPAHGGPAPFLPGGGGQPMPVGGPVYPAQPIQTPGMPSLQGGGFPQARGGPMPLYPNLASLQALMQQGPMQRPRGMSF